MTARTSSEFWHSSAIKLSPPTSSFSPTVRLAAFFSALFLAVAFWFVMASLLV